MMKALLVGFVSLICVVSYASPNNQPTQRTNSNSTNPSSHQPTLMAAGAIQFMQPWARPTTNVANQVSSSAMYFTLVNTTGNSYSLVNISSDGIGEIEIHKTITDSNGVSQMVSVDYPLLISGRNPANNNDEAIINFVPGGLHVMLYGLKRTLNVGDNFNVTFFFDDGTAKTVNVQVASNNPYPQQGN